MEKVLQLVPALLAALRQVVNFVAAEGARRGKTTEEIFAEAGAKLEANDAALLADLVIYGPEGPLPAVSADGDTK